MVLLSSEEELLYLLCPNNVHNTVERSTGSPILSDIIFTVHRQDFVGSVSDHGSEEWLSLRKRIGPYIKIDK